MAAAAAIITNMLFPVLNIATALGERAATSKQQSFSMLAATRLPPGRAAALLVETHRSLACRLMGGALAAAALVLQALQAAAVVDMAVRLVEAHPTYRQRLLAPCRGTLGVTPLLAVVPTEVGVGVPVALAQITFPGLASTHL